jgi:hypothetical protein
MQIGKVRHIHDFECQEHVFLFRSLNNSKEFQNFILGALWLTSLFTSQLKRLLSCPSFVFKGQNLSPPPPEYIAPFFTLDAKM